MSTICHKVRLAPQRPVNLKTKSIHCPTPSGTKSPSWQRRDDSDNDSDSEKEKEMQWMEEACEIWWDQKLAGNDSLTPPYIDMTNWYSRLGLTSSNEEKIDHNHVTESEDLWEEQDE